MQQQRRYYLEDLPLEEAYTRFFEALEEAGCQGFYYYNITGQGRQRGVEVFVGRGGQMQTRSSVPKTLIRTVVADGMKDAVVNAILASARGPGEGDIGDGKIFVTAVADAVRVRTGEHGDEVV